MCVDAIKVKIDKLFHNKIFKDDPLPEKQQPIIIKFIFDIRYKKDRTVMKFKACLVARSFTQIYRVDYKKTFLLIVKYEILRLLLKVAAKLSLHID